MPTTEFYGETDWESSSGPILSRQFALSDLWPEGLDSESNGTGDKDILEDGLHPFLGIGLPAMRPHNIVGVVMSYNADAGLVQMNIAPGFCAKAYVANVLTYGGGTPATFDQSLAIGQIVYLDDSDSLDEGVTLSLSPLNDDSGVNPQVGILFYDQDDYANSGIGGPNATADWPKTVANELVYTLVTVMLWPDAY